MPVQDLARALVRRSSVVRRSAAFHQVQRWRAFRGVALRPELTPRQDLLAELAEKGFAVVPDYVSSSEAGDLLESVDRCLAEARQGKVPYQALGEETAFAWRISQAEEWVPETSVFFSDTTIRGLADALISPNAVSFRHEVDYRFGIGASAYADLYHFDNWRPILKAFLYLTDVEAENAPFVYMSGSHRPESWRRAHERAFDADGKTGRFGYVFPQEMADLRTRHDWEEHVCTGGAGTLVLADLRGLHRGTALKSGRRVLLNNTFDLMNA